VGGGLTSHNSWTGLTLALGASSESHLALYRQLLDGKITPEDANGHIGAIWRATGNANQVFIQKVFRNIPLRPGALTLARWLNRRQFRACLISGSMDMYVATIADRLQIKDWFANGKLIFDDQGGLIGLEYSPNQSATKLVQLNKFCLQEKLDISKVMVVGDGANDIELFQATNHGILVADEPPAADVQAVAWKTVTSLNDIPAILSNH